ncbi:MAG: tRNA pseudouridine(38-40) synthase TruA [Deltaproteobacteria bacterium]|nr:tRNA pseudouridine(38-40) synthase TruA [Deltaproteobacteria bacterium]
MEKRFKIILEYDGTGYHGWQLQAGDVTVQEKVEDALEILTGKAVRVHGSGRTDAGVHALAQVAHFSVETRLGPEDLQKALNGLLPQDIMVKGCFEADPAFHARKSAKKKTYAYYILNRPFRSALLRNHSWHIKRPLDLDAMNRAASRLAGTLDFKSFESTGSPRASTVRTVFSSSFENAEGVPGFFAPTDGLLAFTISADGFLRCMVRNIVGTLVEAGRGKLAPDDVTGILAARDRQKAGPAAPPQGLFLVEVVY